MELTAMRFKDYTWPYNPESCRCVWERKLLRRKLPLKQLLKPLQKKLRKYRRTRTLNNPNKQFSSASVKNGISVRFSRFFCTFFRSLRKMAV